MTYAGFPQIRKRSGKGENRISLGLEKVSKVWNGSGFRWEHARGDHCSQQNGLRWDRATGLKSTWCSYNQGHVEFTLNGMETLHPEPASGCTGESYRSNCWREETSSNGNGHHGDVIKWKRFPCYWPFVRGNPPVPDGFPSQRPVTRSFEVFSLICVWAANNRDAGDLRDHHAHYDVTIVGMRWTATANKLRSETKWAKVDSWYWKTLHGVSERELTQTCIWGQCTKEGQRKTRGVCVCACVWSCNRQKVNELEKNKNVK